MAIEQQLSMSTMMDEVPCLRPSDVVIGEELGKGSFCVVSSINGLCLGGSKVSDGNNENFADDANEEIVTVFRERRRKGSAENETLQGDNEEAGENEETISVTRCAIKVLRGDLPKEKRLRGEMDLIVEAKVLFRLSHPNVVTMYAASSAIKKQIESHSSFDRYRMHGPWEYFVIEERLYETLLDRAERWRQEMDVMASLPHSLFREGQRARTRRQRIRTAEVWLERLTVARGIASALKYLHSLNIVYRDLKPENVGFDAKGNPKIFDLGMAKELPLRKKCNGVYNLTGNTGSARYMAPEVAMCFPYNESVDCYSFGIVLWQLCSLRLPFEGFSRAKHYDLVVLRGIRPKVQDSWPKGLAQLMKSCWSVGLTQRPSCSHIVDRLDAILESLDYR